MVLTEVDGDRGDICRIGFKKRNPDYDFPPFTNKFVGAENNNSNL